MIVPRSRALAAAVLLGMVTANVGVASGQDEVARLQRENARLKRQLEAVQASLVEANEREKQSADALARIKLRLEALGKNLIDEKDDRAVDAVANMTVLDRRLQRMEEAAIRLSASMQAYLKTAITADPEARAEVEAQMRELEVELGLRTRPQRHVDRGNLQHAKVKSIDQDSGLVVLNVGEKENARIGMVFEILRGDELIAEAMVAETRPDVCGVFVQRLENEDDPVRFNDTASLKTN